MINEEQFVGKASLLIEEKVVGIPYLINEKFLEMNDE